jgi:hypothetical protein
MRVENCEWMYNPLSERLEAVSDEFILFVAPGEEPETWFPGLSSKSDKTEIKGDIHTTFDNAAKAAIELYNKQFET